MYTGIRTSPHAPTLDILPHLWAQNEPALLPVSPHNSDGSNQIKPRLKCSTPTFSHGRCKQEKPNQELENIHILQEQQPLNRPPLSLPSPQKFIDHHHLLQHPDKGMMVLNSSPLTALRC